MHNFLVFKSDQVDWSSTSIMEDLDRPALQERRTMDFELSGECHSGQPGVYVYSSIDIATGTPIAVKRHFLDTDTEKQNAQVAVYEDTAKWALQLGHQNVVKHLGFQREFPSKIDLQIPQYFVIMELCAGPTLKTAVQTPLSPTELQNWTKDLLLGIEYLHEKEIVHKDIVSRNLFLSCIRREESILKIGDFDRSQRLKSHDTLPNEVTFGGSTDTMAPEMLAKLGFKSTDLHVGRKSDIFSVGCVVTEMMQSTLVFPVLPEDDYRSVAPLFAEYILHGGRATPPLSCCAEIVELLDSCLQKDPDKRLAACELLELPFFRIKPQSLQWVRRAEAQSREATDHAQIVLSDNPTVVMQSFYLGRGDRSENGLEN